MAQHGIGQAQVALGVLEVDGIDLVRHGGRADLARLGLLLEVADADVAPHVARQVDQDGVGSGHRVEQLGHVVVRLDLDAVGLEGEAQARLGRVRSGLAGGGRLDHAAAEGFPVEVGPGAQVCVVVAHGAVHLGQQLDLGDAIARGRQAHHHVGQLLAHRGGAGRLAVGAAQHGHGSISVRQLAQLGNDGIQLRQQHRVAPRLQLQGVAGVVDVLAGAGEVHELGGGLQLGPALELVLDPVFDRLHVVVGGLLDGLDGGAIGFGEVAQQFGEVSARFARQRLEFVETGIRQGDEPGQLHLHTALHVAQLAHDGTEGRQLGGVAAVERRNGGERGQVHAPDCRSRPLARP